MESSVIHAQRVRRPPGIHFASTDRLSQTASDKPSVQTFKGAEMSRSMLSYAEDRPVTKQTARLNWKDFRLRATLYVNVEKKGQRDSARGCGRLRCGAIIWCAFSGVRLWTACEKRRGKASTESIGGWRPGFNQFSSKRRHFRTSRTRRRMREPRLGSGWGDDPRPPVGFVAE
ncbi:hypothetical protein BJV78DRAFT_1198929 [Lactifluus subvellereus]|nr:hypothetical protein BJV78DRAFT_1198929 [Lactifluus subvellereus]